MLEVTFWQYLRFSEIFYYSHLITTFLHVNKIMFYADITILHVNIIFLHVDIFDRKIFLYIHGKEIWHHNHTQLNPFLLAVSYQI